MVGRVAAAAAIAASLCAGAHADDGRDTALFFETSESMRFWWTEIANFLDQPKAWDGIVSPEIAASLRLTAGSFEATAEVGALADRFDHFGSYDADSLRVYLSAGLNEGDWSYFLEWERFNVYAPGYGTFYVGFDTANLFVAKRFAANVLPEAPAGQFTAALTAGYTAATYTPLDAHFASLELEWVQAWGGSFSLTVVPKLEVNYFPHFSARHRRDTVVSLKLAPSFTIGKHITLTLESKASFAFSTLPAKTGETWELTPVFRFQTAL
jgi:hypothetical protein